MSLSSMKKHDLEIVGRHKDGLEWRVTAHEFQPGSYSAVVTLRANGSSLNEIAHDIFNLSLLLMEQLSGGDNEPKGDTDERERKKS